MYIIRDTVSRIIFKSMKTQRNTGIIKLHLENCNFLGETQIIEAEISKQETCQISCINK